MGFIEIANWLCMIQALFVSYYLFTYLPWALSGLYLWAETWARSMSDLKSVFRVWTQPTTFWQKMTKNSCQDCFVSPFSLSLHSGKRHRLCSCIITMHIGCSSPEKINQLRKDELSFAFFLFSIPGLHKRRTRTINRNSSHDICPMAAIPTDQLNLANKSLTSGGLFKWSPISFLRTPVSWLWAF